MKLIDREWLKKEMLHYEKANQMPIDESYTRYLIDIAPGGRMPLPLDETTLEMAVTNYGEDTQVLIAIEEMSELTHALTKWLRNKDDKDLTCEHGVLEEMADVIIMLYQLCIIVEDNHEAAMRELQVWIDNKVDRLWAIMYEAHREKGENDERQD